MPDLTPVEPRPASGDPLDEPLFRVTGYYADDVLLPFVAGEMAAVHNEFDEMGADEAVMILGSRTDLGRILVERRDPPDFNNATTNSEWKAWRTWTRTEDGHGWRHS